jgi:hypothetical protein
MLASCFPVPTDTSSQHANLPNLGSPALYVKIKVVQELLDVVNQN